MSRHAASWWQQAVHNRLVALVLAMAVIVPLIAAPMAESSPAIAALAFEGFAIALLTTLLWRTRWNLGRDSVVKFLRTGANLPVLLFLGLVVVSCALAPHKSYSLQEVLRIGSGVLLYFVVVYQFRRSEYLSKLVDTLLFLTISASLVGFVQYAASPAEYATGLFGDHQLFGSFLMILLPVIAVVAITETKPSRQLAAQIATILTATCLLVTHARSAWIGAAAGMATLAVLALVAASRRSRLGARKHELVLPAMLLIVAAGFFLLIWPQTSSILGRATSLANAGEESGWQYRQQMWQGTLKMIKERPVTGFGAGLYPYYQAAYTENGAPMSCIGGDQTGCATCGSDVSVNAASTVRNIRIRPTLSEQAHNFYLQTAAELGVPGLLVMVAVLVTFLVGGVMRVRTMDAGIRRSLLMGALGATVAFAADAAGSPSWQLGQVSMFFWLILGLGVGCMRPFSRHEDIEAHDPGLSPRVTRPLTAFAAVGLVALLPLLAFACPLSSYSSVLSATLGAVNQGVLTGTKSLNKGFYVKGTFTNPGHRPSVETVTCCKVSQFIITKVGRGSALLEGCSANNEVKTYRFTTLKHTTTTFTVIVKVTYNKGSTKINSVFTNPLVITVTYP